MDNDTTGGSAFPCDGGGQFAPQSGMTLRDYFAAQAMQSMVRLKGLTDLNGHQRAVAEQAYSMADALLKARENR